MIFESLEVVEELIAKAKTNQGLQVFAPTFKKVYHTGQKVTKEFKKMMEIVI
ncbi:MAG: hypothetical protein GVY04_12940 [Cyanobacteria bacterium]|nr:hypothetical protein [Cyanobacteria bacterium GSL.Bin1]